MDLPEPREPLRVRLDVTLDQQAALLDAVQRAGQLLLTTWPGNPRQPTTRLASSRKPDGSLVTDADRASEQLLTQAITRSFPGARLIAEEDQSTHARTNGTLWFLDPLDGTRQYLDGSPDFAILLSAWTNGRPQLSVAALPAEDILAIAHQDRARIQRPSSPDQLAQPPVHAVYCDPPGLREALPAGTDYRIDAYEAARVLIDLASGLAAAAVIEMCGQLAWDIAPLLHLVTATGGTITDETGREVRLVSTLVPARHLVAARTPDLHRILLDSLGLKLQPGPADAPR